MKKEHILRGLIYAGGIVFISLGVTLSTKTGLGVSSVTSLPFSIANATGLDFSIMTFTVYGVLILLQFIIRGKQRRWSDLLQFPVSIVFSAFLDWFGTLFSISFPTLWQNLLLLLVALLSTGVGIAMMVDMHIIPNPPDGMAQAMSVAMKKDLGTAKNILDFACVGTAIAVDLLSSGRFVSVGIGTIIAMVALGRIIAVFDHFFRKPMMAIAGLE